MPDADNAARGPTQRLVSELKVSGHLMNLDPGLFCIVQSPSKAPDPSIGLPGVRISLPPGAASNPDAVSITAFRQDGFLHSGGDAALVRVVGRPAQVLVTVYQAQGVQDSAPNIQVLRLLDAAGGVAEAPAQIAQAAVPPAMAPEVMDMVAHIQGRGDVGGHIGEWLGEPGSKRWIEGFAVAPLKDLTADDLEYQAVLGRGWMSPWVEGGQYCGSRGMALPILGLRVRLKGEAAAKFDCAYSASFIDGTRVGPVSSGEACEAESLAAVEAVHIAIRPKVAAGAASGGGIKASRARPVNVTTEAVAPDKQATARKPAVRGRAVSEA